MIAWRRFTRLRLWHMIVAIAVLGLAFNYLSNRRQRQIESDSTYLRFSQSRPDVARRDKSAGPIHISVELPEVEVSYMDFPPYGSPDDCRVYRRGNPGRSISYNGPNPKWSNSLYSPMPAEHLRRYHELYAIFLKRISARRRAYLEDPVGSGIDFLELPSETIKIRLEPYWLNPAEPEIDYAYWKTPPERW